MDFNIKHAEKILAVDGVDQKGKRNAKQSDLSCSVACHRWVKREWEAADEVSEEPNRIKSDER